MPRYVVYEVWTSARIVEADDESAAYAVGRPEPRKDLDLCNWHAIEITEPRMVADGEMRIHLAEDHDGRQ